MAAWTGGPWGADLETLLQLAGLCLAGWDCGPAVTEVPSVLREDSGATERCLVRTHLKWKYRTLGMPGFSSVCVFL